MPILLTRPANKSARPSVDCRSKQHGSQLHFAQENSGRFDQERPFGHPHTESRRGVLMMTGLLPFKSVPTTAVVLSALCAGAGLAEAATYLQTNLVSDIPGLATLTDPNLTNTWGVSSFRQSLLDLEPRRQYIKSLRGDRQHRRQQAKLLPGGIPWTSQHSESDPPRGPPARSQIRARPSG